MVVTAALQHAAEQAQHQTRQDRRHPDGADDGRRQQGPQNRLRGTASRPQDVRFFSSLICATSYVPRHRCVTGSDENRYIPQMLPRSVLVEKNTFAYLPTALAVWVAQSSGVFVQACTR